MFLYALPKCRKHKVFRNNLSSSDAKRSSNTIETETKLKGCTKEMARKGQMGRNS